MIKYNTNTINDWNFDSSNIVKVYHNGAVCYYKLEGSPTPTGQTPCYAVVDDITQYSSTEFVDVFDKATKKWYKLNNLNQYEEYGVYGTGRDITYYEGKLTIDNGYEYEYSTNGGWVNRGELVGSSTIIKSPEYIERTSAYNGYCSLLEYLTADTKIIIKHRQTKAGGGRIIGDYNTNDADDWRFCFFGSTLYYDFITERKNTYKPMPMSAAEEWEVGNYYIKDTASGTYLINGTTQTFSSRPDHMYIYHSGGVGAGESGTDYGQIWYIKIYKNDVLVRDFIPWTDMNGNYGLYDKVNNVTVHTTGQMTASTTVNDVEVGSFEYPLYYPEKQDPPTELIFDTMEESLEYQCPYVGVMATIGGVKYKFTYDEQHDTYQWSEITESFQVNLNSQWADGSTSYGDISDTKNYEFYQSASNYHVDSSTATMFITINGYTSFTFKVRNYSEPCCDYVVVNNLDDTTIPTLYPSVGSGPASSGYVYYKNNDKSSTSTWYDVTFDNLDSGEHIITVTYLKDSLVANYDDRGYVAIPIHQ